MTTDELLTAVENWLGALTTGYTVRYGEYSLEDVQDNLPIMELRKLSNGRIDSSIHERSVRIITVSTRFGHVDAQATLEAIAAKSRDNTEAPPVGAIKIRLLNGAMGPFEMENENRMLYLDLMVTT